MRIGLDLDHTIIRYDALLHDAAAERGLIPGRVTPDQTSVQAYVQRHHGDDAWTLLQAKVYGPLLERAQPFPGVDSFFRHCRAAGFEINIFSHKSQFPALGARCDLRVAALNWFEKQGWFADDSIGLSPAQVEFHDTQSAKIRAIARRGCDIFVDHRPEIFAEPEFPPPTVQILFDPGHIYSATPNSKPARSWREIEEAVFSPVPA